MAEIDIGRFDSMFLDAENHCRSLFAEQRSNIQLYAGDHYARVSDKLRQSEREGKLSEEARIRLTENHIQLICKRYMNSIYNTIGGIGIEPHNKFEPSDRKNAENFHSVYKDIEDRHLSPSELNEFFNFVVTGELFKKYTWDTDRGFEGYEQFEEVDGRIVNKPKFKGDQNVEILPSYDVLTSPAKVPFEKCPHLFIRKLVQTKNLKKQFPDKATQIVESSGEKQFRIWNTVLHDYEVGKKGMTLVRELYIRPCAEFPEGLWAIATEDILIDQGVLPLGLFPIDKVGFDDIEQSSRSRSIIKQLRPIQAEINRMISKIAEHQVTLGDDKIVTFDGSTVSQSVRLPGIRHLKVNGQVQQFIQGRTGDQYLTHYESKVAALYRIAMLDVQEALKTTSNQDPMALLYQSMKQKKQFDIYEQKFHKFKIREAKFLLKMTQAYISDSALIAVIGKSEHVNIPEFKSKEPNAAKFNVVERSKDLDTQFATQIATQHIIQYIGKNLPPEIMAAVMSEMPFFKNEKISQMLTTDLRSIENDILALDRGQYVPATQYDNHDLFLKYLTSRIKEPDFEFVKKQNPQVEQMYMQRIQEHEQIKAEQLRQIAAAQQGFIPMGGGMVALNMSSPDPQTGKNRRLYLPTSSVEWLLKKLQEQGMSMGQMQGLSPAIQAQTLSLVRQSSTVPGGQEGEQQPQQQGVQPTQMPQDDVRRQMLEMIQGGQRGQQVQG